MPTIMPGDSLGTFHTCSFFSEVVIFTRVWKLGRLRLRESACIAPGDTHSNGENRSPWAPLIRSQACCHRPAWPHADTGLNDSLQWGSEGTALDAEARAVLTWKYSRLMGSLCLSLLLSDTTPGEGSPSPLWAPLCCTVAQWWMPGVPSSLVTLRCLRQPYRDFLEKGQVQTLIYHVHTPYYVLRLCYSTQECMPGPTKPYSSFTAIKNQAVYNPAFAIRTIVFPFPLDKV